MNDETRRNATASATESDPLAPQQEVALEALIAGSTVTEAARAADVSRQTVSGWLHHDLAFVAAMRTRRSELWATLSARLEARANSALDALAAMLEHEDWRARIAAARSILERAPIPGHAAAPVFAEPADVSTERKERLMLREMLELAVR